MKSYLQFVFLVSRLSASPSFLTLEPLSFSRYITGTTAAAIAGAQPNSTHVASAEETRTKFACAYTTHAYSFGVFYRRTAKRKARAFVCFAHAFACLGAC